MPLPPRRAAIEVERLLHRIPAHQLDQALAVFRWDADENDGGVAGVGATDHHTKFSMEASGRGIDRDQAGFADKEARLHRNAAVPLVQVVERGKHLVQAAGELADLAQNRRTPGVIQLRGRIARGHGHGGGINAFDGAQDLRRLILRQDSGNSRTEQSECENKKC